jgi:hypothetical protein
MKNKLIAFNVTNTLEKGVGERVGTVAVGSDNTITLFRESGIPISERGLSDTGIHRELKRYFGKKVKLVPTENENTENRIPDQARDFEKDCQFLLSQGLEARVMEVQDSKTAARYFGLAIDETTFFSSGALLQILSRLPDEIRGQIVKINLSEIFLDNTRVNLLLALRNLKELDLSRATKLIKGRILFSKLQTLMKLNVEQSAISDGEIAEILKLPDLIELNVSRCLISKRMIERVRAAFIQGMRLIWE